MKVYVCGYRGHGFGAKAIERFTFGRFSHVSLVFDDGVGLPKEIEAIQWKGVHEKKFNPNKGNYTLFRVPCDAYQGEQAYELAKRHLGKKYDWLGIWSFVVRKERENPNRWFCSELVFWVLEKIKVLLLRKKHFEVNPDMVCSSTVIYPVSYAPDRWFEEEA